MPEPERDAFGNPIDRGRTATLPSAAVAADPADDAARPPTRAPRPPTAPTRPLRWLFALLCVAATAAVLWQADLAERDAPAVLGRELDGHDLADGSLVRAANLRRALAAIRAELRDGERVALLRVEPERVVARTRDRDGGARALDVDLAFAVRASDAGTESAFAPLPLRELDPTVPQRVARRALAQAGAADDQLSYLTLSGAGDRAPTWLVSIAGVQHDDATWVADLAGVAVTRPGELPPAAGIRPPSLLAPRPLARALAALAEHGRGVTALRVEPQRLDATVVGRDGAVDAQVDAAQRVTARPATTLPTPTLTLRAIAPDSLRRAITTAARRGGFAPSRIAYAVLQPDRAVASEPGWLLFFDGVGADATHWRASLDGREVTR